jgi:hypothetical protein
MYEIMSQTDLIKIYSRVELQSLGDYEDVIVIVDTEDENYHIYLQEELENYSYVCYKNRYYKLSNKEAYYELINDILSSN